MSRTQVTRSGRAVSRAQARNQALREALREEFPAVKFSVRNGAGGLAAVSWVDGPGTGQVREMVSAVPSDRAGHPWGARYSRRTSPLLVAVSYLRARAEGSFYYEERDRSRELIAPGCRPRAQ